MKLLLAVWIAGLAGAAIAAASMKPDESMCQVTCSPAEMVNVRLYAAECVADGSAAVECMERARMEYCQ